MTWNAQYEHIDDNDMPDHMLTAKKILNTAYWLEQRVTKSEIEDLRVVIGSFSGGTAVVFDNIEPRVLDHVSDEAIVQLIRLYNRCET